MINPNGDEFPQHDPLGGSTMPSESPISSTSPSRFQETTQKASAVAANTWRQTKETAGTARERTEFYLRENPVPTIIGALAIGLAIGLAIRYSSESAEKEVAVKSPLGDINLGMLSLPFLWPFFKQVQRKYEDSADVVKDGVDKLKQVDVDRYVKPLRKQWRTWTK